MDEAFSRNLNRVFAAQTRLGCFASGRRADVLIASVYAQHVAAIDIFTLLKNRTGTAGSEGLAYRVCKAQACRGEVGGL